MENQFFGKTILITGASNGLGRMCAKSFESKGASLIICGRNREQLDKLQSGFLRPDEHTLFEGDLAEPSKVGELASLTKAKKRIDVILHVMGGGLGKREPLIAHEDFDLLFRTNLGSGAELNRHLIPMMVDHGCGHVLHVGSVASEQAVASVGYNSVKAALAAYVRSLGRELASTGVVVTGILPGGYQAPGNSWERLKEKSPEVVENFISEKQPRGKLGSYKEIIPLIEFLCSENATMMTGCCVPIDGGEGITYAG